MSSYVRSLVGLRSRFDRYVRGETNDFSPAEKNGFNLFMGKARCGTCHYAPFFNGLTPPLYQETESETLGVPAADGPGAVLDADPGRYKFTGLPLHQYSFRTPTVRNAALTAPYMHNGAFATLESVIDFYNDGGGAGRGIDIPTQTLPADKLGLTPAEKQDIIAFMHALTDTVTVY
jgi:cytochrome c peroxidase